MLKPYENMKQMNVEPAKSKTLQNKNKKNEGPMDPYPLLFEFVQRIQRNDIEHDNGPNTISDVKQMMYY